MLRVKEPIASTVESRDMKRVGSGERRLRDHNSVDKRNKKGILSFGFLSFFSNAVETFHFCDLADLAKDIYSAIYSSTPGVDAGWSTETPPEKGRESPE